MNKNPVKFVKIWSFSNHLLRRCFGRASDHGYDVYCPFQPSVFCSSYIFLSGPCPLGRWLYHIFFAFALQAYPLYHLNRRITQEPP